MSLTTEQIEAVAPDQASLTAASKLLKRNKWPMLQHNDDASILWGQCQGSGSTPYSMSVAMHDLGAKCSCPSRKFPCKHSIALMWWYADNAAEFSVGEIPEWVSDWLSRRRGSAASKEESTDSGKPKLNASAAKQAGKEKSLDPEAEKAKAERSAKRKEKTRLAREKSVAEGLDALDLWITDEIQQGLAGFDARAHQQAQTVIKRLVDAKAPGLALRVENLLAKYYGAKFNDRNPGLIEDLGMLHLLAEAYRRQESLPESLRQDIRQAIGWTVDRADLLENSSAVSRTGEWFVAGVRETVQPDKLIRKETWLAPADNDSDGAAVLMDFVPVSSGAAGSAAYRSGQRVKGTLTFYPSATPLRALVSDSSVAESSATTEFLNSDSKPLPDAVEDFLQQRANNPWLNEWPIVVRDARFQKASDDALWLVANDGGMAVEITGIDPHDASVLLGVTDLTLFGLFNGQKIEPMSANTPLGPWWGSS